MWKSDNLYYLDMKLTLSLDDDIVELARRHAEAVGKSLDELVRDYVEILAGKSDLAAVAEFHEMSRNPQGNSRGWKFNREEIHERR